MNLTRSHYHTWLSIYFVVEFHHRGCVSVLSSSERKVNRGTYLRNARRVTLLYPTVWRWLRSDILPISHHSSRSVQIVSEATAFKVVLIHGCF